MKKVLIAHQSTIPHYRVPFYQTLERLRPKWWCFYVVYDINERKKKIFFKESVDYISFNFNIEKTHTLNITLKNKNISFQSFVLKALNYDLLIVENALNNLSYPLSHLYKLLGKSIIYWGHGRDLSVNTPIGIKNITEKIKMWLIFRSDGFLAYTKTVHNYLINKGVNKNKIFKLYNTIDIKKQRLLHNKLIQFRNNLRKKHGFIDKKVLLYVGRLSERKHLDFLADAFYILRKKDPNYKLLIIGGGDPSYIDLLRAKGGKDAIHYYGIIVDDNKLAPLFALSDLYVLPGDVGLGPLHALCFDLTPVIINSKTHGPEFDYLNKNNSLILPSETNAKGYAKAIDNILKNKKKWLFLRTQAWPSIRHLTIENMAHNFIHAVNCVLSTKEIR